MTSHMGSIQPVETMVAQNVIGDGNPIREVLKAAVTKLASAVEQTKQTEESSGRRVGMCFFFLQIVRLWVTNVKN